MDAMMGMSRGDGDGRERRSESWSESGVLTKTKDELRVNVELKSGSMLRRGDFERGGGRET